MSPVSASRRHFVVLYKEDMVGRRKDTKQNKLSSNTVRLVSERDHNSTLTNVWYLEVLL